MNKIKQYRESLKMTQEELARKVKCTLRQIQNIEQEKSKPNVYLAIRIQEALNVKEIKDLFN